MNTLSELFSNAAAQRIGWALIHFVWQGAAVALVLGMLLALLRHRSAQARWVVSCAALALLAALPVATALTVSAEAPGRSESPPAAGTAERTAPPGAAAEPPTGTVSPAPAGLAHNAEPLEAAPLSMPPAPTGQGEQTAAVSWPRQLQGAIQPALPWATAVWLAGVLAMSVWHMGGWLRVRRMGRLGARAAGAAAQETFDRVFRRLRIARPVRLLESLRVAVPVVVGWLRPVVLLPVGAVTGLTPRQVEAILAHELAHVRRWDCLVQALQAVLETLLFYHPAVWWVSRQIRRESEHCCDDLAVGVCGDRSGYAHALGRVAELGAAGRRGGAGQPAFAAAATGGKVLPRIRRILGLESDRYRYGRPYVAAVVTLGILLVVGVFCACFSGDSYASAGPARPPAPRQGMPPVSGRVLTRPGGTGVADATVELWSNWWRGSRLARTDGEGRFGFSDVAPGVYMLRTVDRPAGVESEGATIYVVEDPRRAAGERTRLARVSLPGGCSRLIDAGTDGNKPLGDLIEATVVNLAGGAPGPVELYEERPQSISGTVTDARTGEPVPGAILRFGGTNRRLVEVRTDAKGRYRVYVLPVKVSVSCGGTPERYYHAEQHHNGVRVAAGRHVSGRDFRVRSAASFEGHVSFVNGSDAPEGVDVWVFLSWRDSRDPPPVVGGQILMHDTIQRRKTDADGKFTAYVRSPSEAFPHQKVTITAFARTPDGLDGGMARWATTNPFDPKVKPVEITLDRSASATFDIVGPDGRGVTNIGKIRAFKPSPPPAEVRHLGRGRYRIDGLIPGLGYRWYVEAPGYRHRYPGDAKPIVLERGQHLQAPPIRLEWWNRRLVPGLIAQAARGDQGSIWDLGRLGPEAAGAVATLAEVLGESTDKEARRLAAQALGKIGRKSRSAVPALIGALQKDAPKIARAAAEALARIGDARGLAPMKAAMAAGRIDEPTGLVACWRIARAARTAPAAGRETPTAATLGKWLAGKEVVEVCFAGPHMEPLKLRDSLTIKPAANDWDFRLTPGEGGGVNRSFVEVCMRVSPENTRRLLALQKELAPRGYRLDPEHSRAWSFDGDPNARATARAMAPKVLAAAADAIRAALPKAQTSPERPRRAMYLAGIRYEVPGTNIRGTVRINEITPTKRWQLAAAPEQTVHLPHLGLMVMAYYRPGRDTTGDVSPERAAIRKAVQAAVAPLRKLEDDAARLRAKPRPPSGRLSVHVFRIPAPPGRIDKLRKAVGGSHEGLAAFARSLKPFGRPEVVGSVRAEVPLDRPSRHVVDAHVNIVDQRGGMAVMLVVRGRLAVTLKGMTFDPATSAAGRMSIETQLTDLTTASRARPVAVAPERVSPFQCKHDGEVRLGTPFVMISKPRPDKSAYVVWARLKTDVAPAAGGATAAVLPALHALKQDVMALSRNYPQLAGAKAVEATADGWLFEHDCRYMGKRGYENTGPFPVAVGLRVMTVAQFRVQVSKVPMQGPGYRWEYLGLVGWTTLHTAPGIPGALVGKLQDALTRALVKIGRLNRQALDARLPRAIRTERERRLAAADAAIRKGLQRLAERHPLLKKGRPWDRLSTPSGPGRIGIHLRRQRGGKGGTDARDFPPSEAYSVLVVIKPPPDEIEQLVLVPMYRNLGLVGQVGVRAADPQLDLALKKLVSEALAPLSELERRASAAPKAPATPATPPAGGARANPRIRWDGNTVTLAHDATDADLAALRDVRGIVELRMGGGPNGTAGPYVTDAGLANLDGWADLEVLYLPGSPAHDRRRYPNVTHFTDAALTHLRGLAKLRKLVLVDQEITDEGLANLSRLTELRELWLDFIPLSDRGLKHLSGLRKLQVLRLYGASVTDKGLRHLAGMADMRDLQLGRAGVGDKGLATVIRTMRRLETLDLQGNPVSDDGLSALESLTNLRWLALSHTPITDRGLKHVAGLHKLEYLFLDGTGVTDAGLAELARLKRLKRLKVERTSVTAGGIRKLKVSLPALDAVRSPRPPRSP